MKTWWLSVLAILIFSCGEEAPKKKTKPAPTEKEEVVYMNEGTITFYGEKDTSTITFELANTPAEIQKGLMYRDNMPDSVGMLFRFPNEDMRSFWMKNTNIPLDIIFVKSNLEIENIEAYAQPYSQYSLPSTGPAQYVIEVNAGYSEKRGIQSGTKIEINYK